MMDLQERIETLEAELAYWKSEAAGVDDAVRDMQLAKALSLTPVESWIVGRLYSMKPGRPLSAARITDDAPGLGEDHAPGSNVAQVFINRIRKKLGADAIETVWSKGYVLSAAGRALVEPYLCQRKTN